MYGPTAALGDNEALFKTVHHESHSARVRHYERATLLFKRAVLLLLIKPYKISDVDMVADILAKAVEKAKFTKMRDFMMNVHSTLAFIRYSFTRAPKHFSRIRFVKHPLYTKNIRIFSPKTLYIRKIFE